MDGIREFLFKRFNICFHTWTDTGNSRFVVEHKGKVYMRQTCLDCDEYRAVEVSPHRMRPVPWSFFVAIRLLREE